MSDILGGAISGIIVMLLIVTQCGDSPEVGMKYEDSFKSPFENTDTIKVLNIEDGWVQYSIGRDTSSKIEFLFKFYFDKIQD